MKWFFRGIALIFGLFALAIAAGALMPATVTLERSVEIDADMEDVSDALTDLRGWPDWSPLIPQGTEIAVADEQSAAWQEGAGIGSVELVQGGDDALVRADVVTDGDLRKLTFALIQDGAVTTVLLMQEQAFGGFPFMDRLRGRMRQGAETRDLEASLDRLKTLLEDR